MDGIFLDQYPLLKQRAEAYIREGCKELGKLKDVNEKELYEVAMKIYEKLIENSPEWEGYHPRTTVAGVLYIAGLVQQEGEDGISQREISEVMNVTILFIKKKYIEIANELGFSPVYLQQHQLRAGLAHLKRYITELVRG